MVFERGPLAFIKGTIQLVRQFITEGSPMQHLAIAAASQISERVAVLTTLQRHLATLLAEVFREILSIDLDLKHSQRAVECVPYTNFLFLM
jgi:hypothetical protein